MNACNTQLCFTSKGVGELKETEYLKYPTKYEYLDQL